jgi:hypothetical protein
MYLKQQIYGYLLHHLLVPAFLIDVFEPIAMEDAEVDSGQV